MEIEEKIKRKSFNLLSELNAQIIHPKEIKRNYVETGILFLRAQNIRPLKTDLSNQVFVSDDDAEILKNNEVLKEDILITRTGANFGQCSLYLENKKAIGSSHTFILRNLNLSPYFVAVFLNTKYGRSLIDKGMYGGLQPEITSRHLFKIPIPKFNKRA